MRTIIDLPSEQLDALNALCRREGISRAEAIRRAVAAHVPPAETGEVERAFGLWRGRGVDGLAYEQGLRGEWEGRAPREARSKARRQAR